MPSPYRWSGARRAALAPAALAFAALSLPAVVQAGASASDRPQPYANTITLPGEHLHPESLSITGGVAYVGSMTGGVLRVRLARAQIDQFIAPGAFGSGALFGVFADTRHNLLWTCTNSFAAPLTHIAGADPGHWVKAFDLRTGKGKISLPMPGDSPVCNDFALGPDGAIYITDTGQPRILRWKPGATALEVWAEDPIFNAAPPKKAGLDGLAFTADGTLYANNVRDGSLYRVEHLPDGHVGKITKLTTDRPLQSPDGMRSIGKRLLVAEGIGRIARLSINGDNVHVETLDEGIKEPTGVDADGKTAWYVQGQLSGLMNPDKAPPVELPFHMTPVTLGTTFD